jgi:acetoin utilization deacetylase AcuC-like enzyme
MGSSRFGLAQDPCFQEHAPAGYHPERPERLVAIEQALRPLQGRWVDVRPRPATDEEILAVHGSSHLRALCALEGKEAHLDADTYSSPRSLEIARLSAGSAVELARRIAGGELRSGFALVRPPGHHAERLRAMGFCLLNNIAIAAASLRAKQGLERLAILDWDVHHGNGTQHLFEEDRDLLFLSLHQFPFYPGTGSLGERGSGAGTGSTVNLPLPAGCGDVEYEWTLESIVAPVLREFRPELLLVSAGFDAHAQDPLASMSVSSEGFGRMAARVRAVAEEVCDGRLLLILEGGYNLNALGESVREVVQVLADEEPPDADLPAESAPARSLVERFRHVHSEHWRSFR